MNGQGTLARLARATDPGSASLPVAVEEQVVLVDRRTGRTVPVTPPLEEDLLPWVVPERRVAASANTITLASPVVTDLAQLRRALLRSRRAAASVAAAHASDTVAIGVSPFPDPAVEGLGAVGARPAVCGLAVHCAVPDHRVAALVCRHLAVWLPVIRALTANSPYCRGADTGYASWGFVEVQRSTLGAFVAGSRVAGDPDFTASRLQTTEAHLPEALCYQHVSPQRSPGVRILAGDVGLGVDDTVVAAGLIRAAVFTAMDTIRAGQASVEPHPRAVRAAHWQAARHGLAGPLTDPRCGRLRPAQRMLDDLVDTVYPALLAGEGSDLVLAGLARLRADGGGADRQRRIIDRAGGIRPAVPRLAELATAG